MPSGIRRRKFKVGHTGRRRAKKPRKPRLIHDNELIADNWDPKLTLAQNYAKLGLASSTSKPTGGSTEESAPKSLSIAVKTKTAQIVRLDDGTVKIVENEEDDIDEPVRKSQPRTEFARRLEELASVEKPSKAPKVSEDQKSYLQRLIAKHGDDYMKMQWDRKLNPFQYSAGELKKRVRRYGVA